MKPRHLHIFLILVLLMAEVFVGCQDGGGNGGGNSNEPPVANAGPDQTLYIRATVTLDGTGSSDADGDSLTYTWIQTSGITVQLVAAQTPHPVFNAPSASSETGFSLVVNDGEVDSLSDTVLVVIEDYPDTWDQGIWDSSQWR